MAKPSPWNWMVPVVDDSKRATKEFLFWLTGALGTARTAEDALDEAEEAKELAQQALDTKVSKAGDTMTGDLQVPDEAYGPSWDGSAEVPTKNAIYDALQDVSGSISVAKDDTVIVSDVTELNFEGSGIASVTDDGSGKATVTIEGGGSTPSPIWEVTDTGTGSSQNVTIPVSVSNEEDILVFVNGIRYPTSDFSVSGTTVTLTTNSSGDDIRVLGVYNGGSSGGGGGGSGERTRVIPKVADFSLQNAGTTTAVDSPSGTGILLEGPSASSQIRFLKYNAGLPSTPYAVISRFAPLNVASGANYQGCLILRNSANGRLLIMGNYMSSFGQFLVQKWGSYTSYSSSIYTTNVAMNAPFWWGFNNDGTTIEFITSHDGLDWYHWGTKEAISTYLGAVDEAGMAIMLNGSNGSAIFQSFEIVNGTL